MNIDVSQVQAFHGHLCPGLAMGIRVAEKALQEMGERPGDEEVVAVVETNNCAVDAIQYITGCTFGKGNLIHLDYGKNAFRFIRRKDNKAIRILVRPQALGAPSAEQEQLMKRWRAGAATEEEKQQAKEIQKRRLEMILSAPLDDVVEVQNIQPVVPPRAQIFNSVICDACGEKTMETRLHLLGGKVYCPECFEKMTQGR
jgi:formylmethanofuran dehydrogenase subunit E